MLLLDMTATHIPVLAGELAQHVLDGRVADSQANRVAAAWEAAHLATGLPIPH